MSSGVEKTMKIWSPFAIPGCNSLNETNKRPIYTHEEYITMVLRSGQFMNHDYSMENAEEDPRMMAFFDSLIQVIFSFFDSSHFCNSFYYFFFRFFLFLLIFGKLFF